MQFHDYVTIRNKVARSPYDSPRRALAKSSTSSDFRSAEIRYAAQVIKSVKTVSFEEHGVLNRMSAACAEEDWVEHERPYYNIWPVAVGLAESVKLELPFSAVEIPFNAMVLRFACGHELKGVSAAMIWWPKEGRKVFCPKGQDQVWIAGDIVTEDERIVLTRFTKPDDIVEDWFTGMEKTAPQADAIIGQELLRLAVLVGLLAHDEDMITPVVLSKDQAKYDATSNPDKKQWLEDRAARRVGRGFDVGKKLHEQKERAPHWRNPHLCLFWTGPGRTKPVIKMRSGAVIQKVSMADVPTGYLGPERDEEDQEGLTYIYFIEAVGQDRIKIGKADDPEARLKQLQTGCPVPLRLLGIINCQAGIERTLHAKFAEDNIQGEWFQATEAIRKYIEECVGPVDT